MSGVIGRLLGRGKKADPVPETPFEPLFPLAPPPRLMEAEMAAPAAALSQPSAAAEAPPLAFACSRLATAQGRNLCLTAADAAGQRWLAAAPQSGAESAILALIAPALPFACILIAADGLPFAIAGDPDPGPALSGRLLQTNERGIARIKYPFGAGFFLVADDTQGGRLRFDGPGGSMQAAFAFTHADLSSLTQPAQALAGEWARAAAQGLSAAAILSGMASGTLRAELAACLVRLLPQEELDELGRRLLAGGADLARLQKTYPADAALHGFLPALASWHASSRPAANTLRSPPSQEAPLLPVIGTGAVPAGMALNALARRHVLPRRTACLVTTVRNEGAYLLDWIAYHLSIGFEHIFVYANDNTDGSDALLDALARSSTITLIRNERGPASGAQQKAYAHALSVLPQTLDYRWTAILDLDEYLAFDTGMFRNLSEFLGFHEAHPVDAIALCWSVFAALPGETWRAEAVPARITRRVRPIDHHVKSLFRTRQFWSSHAHFPKPTLDAPYHFHTEDGSIHYHTGEHGRIEAFAQHPSANLAWINHYLLRTAEEALWKWSRGRADWVARDTAQDSAAFLHFVAEKFLELGRPEHLVQDRRILSCAEGQGAMLDRLRSLPDVAEAEAALLARFAEQLAATRTAFLATPPAANAPEALLHFREVLESQTL